MQDEDQQREESLDGTDDGEPIMQLAAQSPPVRNLLDSARLAVRNSPLPGKSSAAIRNNKPQIMIVYETRFVQKGAAKGTGLVYCSDAMRRYLTDPVGQEPYKAAAGPDDQPDHFFSEACGNKPGLEGSHADGAKRLFYLADRYGTDASQNGRYKCPGDGADKRDWPPVQNIKASLMDSDLTAEDAGALIVQYDSPTSRKEGQGKNNKTFTKQTKQAVRSVAQKQRKDGSATQRAQGLRAVPMDGRAREHKRDIEAFTFGESAAAPAPPTAAPANFAAAARAAPDAYDLTEDQRERRAVQKAEYEAALEDEKHKALEIEILACKQRSVALRLRRQQMEDGPSTPPPAPPMERIPSNAMCSAEISGLDAAGVLRRSDSMDKGRAAKTLQWAQSILLLFDGKDDSWLPRCPEMAVVLLFMTHLKTQNFLVPTIIGACTRQVKVTGAALGVEFYVSPHAVKRWTDAFGDGSSKTTAVFVDNERGRFLVVGLRQF